VSDAADAARDAAADAARALRERYRAAGIRPAKRLGQHFLADLNLARKIVAELGPPAAASPILEIGPGLGALTFLLAAAGHTAVAVEVDPRLASWLAEALAPWPNAQVIAADIRTFHLDRVAASRLRVVGNLPYYLTSEILLGLKRESARIASAVVMMQDEVAARLLAAPGSRAYSSLTVAVTLDFAITQRFRVPRQAFWPAPDVDSAILRLVPHAPESRGTPAASDRAVIERVVRAGFAQRRKTLASSLAAELAIPRPRLEAHLRALGLDPARRAETLAPADFVRLAAALTDEIRARPAARRAEEEA
jgi:16S rRNA (adenine1518-N6/adenine1519-N6)-dimethyltransferase